ncbi:hypothetical protein L1887_36534 [Cichorium endivia]|nr:hypothetical protein L1887_36534 [Cichorium endivia]
MDTAEGSGDRKKVRGGRAVDGVMYILIRICNYSQEPFPHSSLPFLDFFVTPTNPKKVVCFQKGVAYELRQ